MRGLGDDGELTPEADAALSRAIGEVVDTDDIVISYLVVAVVQSIDRPAPGTLIAASPNGATATELGLAQYAVAKITRSVMDEFDPGDDDPGDDD